MIFSAKTFEELSVGELYEILKARCQIFLMEQGIVCQDMDDVDYDSLHCFLTEGKQVLAYLRAYRSITEPNTVTIGRVITLYHGQGLGRELMEKSLPAITAQLPCSRLALHAQSYAAGYYEKFGFRVTSEEFLEEGIPHVCMVRELEEGQ
ncbi:MAG: GNAT family N-acetyltransferase, partial [Clostridia bacterium]|nr:GNAT family N-acetyltransferase [Clostridia bacterium]